MSKQGCALPEEQVRKIQCLLATTSMSLPEIAERIGCSRSTVVTINRKARIRNYGGSRSKWNLNTEGNKEQCLG
jgi:IS30 family transposase